MALRFIDSLDHYATAQLAEKWTSLFAGTAGVPAVTAGAGRHATAGLRISCPSGLGGTPTQIILTLDNQPTWIFGGAMRFSALPTAEAIVLAAWYDLSALQVWVQLETSGALSAWRGVNFTSGTLLGSLPFGLEPNIFYYLEWRVTFSNTTGVMTVRINGGAGIDLTNVDTQATGNAFASSLRWGVDKRWNVAATLDLDDVYLCDGTGAGPYNGFLGDCRVDCLYPNADGTHSAWTPSAGTTHHTLVDDPTPNGDTDYVSTTTPGARESVNLASLPVLPAPTILGVQTCLNARKEDIAVVQMHSLLVSGATTQPGVAVHSLSNDYKYWLDCWTADPGTGGAWSEASVNALQAGAEAV